jgi:Zn-dependent peptidase ImmA (M78 family)
VASVGEALRGLKVAPKEIADRANLPLQRVEELLGGGKAALSELRAISVGLRVPMHVLAQGGRPSEVTVLEPLFRSARGASVDLDITLERVATFVDAALELLPLRNEPPVWLSEFNVRQTTYVEADRLAKQFRAFALDHPDDAPAFNLPTVLGRLEGVVISRLLFSKYEGVSLIAGNYCFIFVSPRFQGRMLFTLGHELGHIIAHHEGGGEAIFERAGDIAKFGERSRAEAFVDAFSSCLLLPDVGVGKALQTFRQHYEVKSQNVTDLEILLLARFYGVSFDVAARRCEDLGLLPGGAGYAISLQLKKQFGSPEKRAEQLGLPPRQKVVLPAISAHLARAISQAIRRGDASIGWVTDRLGLSIGEVLAINAESDAP